LPSDLSPSSQQQQQQQQLQMQQLQQQQQQSIQMKGITPASKKIASNYRFNCCWSNLP
jgi:hypothetical protein